MSEAYIDQLGLARDPARAEAVAEALELDGDTVLPRDRVALLRRLRRSAGVTVYTGPSGAPFWLPVSVEVKVRIVPDGTDMKERAPADMAWALQVSGLTATEAGALARKPPKTQQHGRWGAWREAESLLAAVVAPGDETPIVHTTFEAEAAMEDEGLRLVDKLREAGDLTSLDYEWDTMKLDPHGLGIATADRNWYVPVEASDYHAPTGFGQKLREVVGEFVRSDTPSVWHNGKADLQTQYPGDPAELAGRPIDDTIIEGYIVGDTTLGLKSMTRARLGRDALDWPGPLSGFPLEVSLRYAGAGDARNTYDLHHALKGPLMVRDPEDVYGRLERPVMPIVASMEKYGQPVSIEALETLRENFEAMEDALRGMWWAAEHLDIADDKQMREVIERRTGYDPGGVSADVLARNPAPWMDSLMGFRRIRHRRRGFVVKHIARWDAAGRPDDFRAYVQFNQAGSPDEQDGRSFRRAPKSGRFSSSSVWQLQYDGTKKDIGFGNLQNQPGGEASIRSAFVAPPDGDFVFWSLDYSGLEMTTGASISGDATMVERLLAGGDFHQAFADDIFGRSGVRIARPAAKRGVFNGAYGGYADSLGKSLRKERIDLPREELVLICDGYRQSFSGYFEAGEAVVKAARGNGGYSESLMGRRRYDQDLFSRDRSAQGHAERALINHALGQGSAADIIKRAMYLTNATVLGAGAHVSLQVHDELAGWCPREGAQEFTDTMTMLMESIALPGQLRLKVSGGHGASWEEVH